MEGKILAKAIAKYILILNEINKGTNEICDETLKQMILNSLHDINKEYPADTYVKIRLEMNFKNFFTKEDLLKKLLNSLELTTNNEDIYTLQKNIKRVSVVTWECGDDISELVDSIDWLLGNISLYKSLNHHEFNLAIEIDINNSQETAKINKSHLEIYF